MQMQFIEQSKQGNFPG